MALKFISTGMGRIFAVSTIKAVPSCSMNFRANFFDIISITKDKPNPGTGIKLRT